jgi:uncharacterized protein (DUF1330 family)
MSAYMVSMVTARDLDWVPDYLAAVPRIVRRYGGEFVAVARPGEIERLEGSMPAPQSVVVFRFPSMDDIKRFLRSPEYGPYRDARIAGTDTTFLAFENDPGAPQFSGG